MPPATLVQAGKFNKRVQIIQPAPTQDSSGWLVEANTVVKTVWASIEPLSGRELFSAQQVNSEVTHKIRIWWRTGIRSEQIVRYGARTFHIEYIINPEEGRKVLELMCIEKAESEHD